MFRNFLNALYEFLRAVLVLILTIFLVFGFFRAGLSKSIVVEQFAVPDLLPKQGLNGQVISSEIVDRMRYMAEIGARGTIEHEQYDPQPPDLPVKVPVPDANLTFEDLYNNLRYIFGVDTYISGEIFLTNEGGRKSAVPLLNIIVRSDGEHLTDCDRREPEDSAVGLIKEIADCIYSVERPDRYARYLLVRYQKCGTTEKGAAECANGAGDAEAKDRRSAVHYFEIGTCDQRYVGNWAESCLKKYPAEDRAWAYEGLGVAMRREGSVNEALAKADIADDKTRQRGFEELHAALRDYQAAETDFGRAREVDTRLAIALRHQIDVGSPLEQVAMDLREDHAAHRILAFLVNADLTRSDDIEADAEQEATTTATTAQKPSDLQQTLREHLEAREAAMYKGDLFELLGNYSEAAFWKRTALQISPPDKKEDPWTDILDDRAYAHDDGVIALVPKGDLLTRVFVLFGLGRWAELRKACEEADSPESATGRTGANTANPTCEQNLTARALFADAYAETAKAPGAEAGLNKARTMIGMTPDDCEICLRMRGKIETSARNWSGAGRWFALATSKAPELPEAYSDWAGELLKEAGSLKPAKQSPDFVLKDAETKAQMAQRYGPYFADGFEVMGDILLAENRADSAVEEFRTAAALAPNWALPKQRLAEALRYLRSR